MSADGKHPVRRRRSHPSHASTPGRSGWPGRWPLPDDVSGLALSEDGARLYAALGGRVTLVDTGTGDATTTLAFGGVESILHVTTP